MIKNIIIVQLLKTKDKENLEAARMNTGNNGLNH